jgi:hypothetical protein
MSGALLVLIVIAFAIPSLPFADVFGFVRLVMIAVITVLYVVVAELGSIGASPEPGT